MTLGNKIQEIRLAKGLSQEQFGELLDTTRQTVSKWELDQVVPDVRKIIAISRLSGVSLDELLLKATNFETEGVPLSGGVYGKSTAEILETVRLALEYYAEGMRRAETDEDRKNLPHAGGKDTGDPQKDIPDIQKICELSKIWKEAAYNFAFWDKVELDWDAEFKKALERVLATKDIREYYRELKRFMVLLNDGHTEVSFPNWMYQDPEYYSMLPLFFGKFGDRIAVVLVSEAYRDRIPLYSTLLRIDGQDVLEYIREKCYPYFWHANEAACGLSVLQGLVYGPHGSGAVYTFEKDGREFELRLEREDPSKIVWRSLELPFSNDDPPGTISSSESHKVFFADDGIAVIRMSSFADNTMHEKIWKCFDELKGAKGYIVDVRGNTGGNSRNADMVASLFIDGDFRSCYAETQVYEPTIKAWSVFREDFKGLSPAEAQERYADDDFGLKSYRMLHSMNYVNDGGNPVTNIAPGKLDGPVVVLMNESTISAAEDFIDVMKQYTDAVFVGTSTAGTSGQPLCGTLESGGFYRICTRRCIAQNGEDIYNRGFTPDIRIRPTVEEFAAGRDVVFEKGLEVLKTKIG